MSAMEGLCEGRVVIVTGGGRGLGRGYAVDFAKAGASVVVNDLGGSSDGSGASSQPAEQVVEEIRGFGGKALANGDDVSDWDGAHRLIDTALRHFGRLDVLVNNAGILRDRMLVNMEPEDWDAVMKVHLRGTFAPSRHAAAYWRGEARADRRPDARIINTTSSSGLFCNPGQSNYGSAKAGIAAFSVISSRELERYGVTVNAIYPVARSRLTEDWFKSQGLDGGGGSADWDPFDPANVARIVVWLGSTRSAGITGRVFGIKGSLLTVAEGWSPGPTFEHEGPLDPAELDEIIPALVARSSGNTVPFSGLRTSASSTQNDTHAA